MKIYLIMQNNGYGNSAVNSTWATKVEAEAECKRLQTSQERYYNHYYVMEKELQGDTFDRSNFAERDIPKARFQCRCGVCDLDLNEVELGTVEIETNEQLRTHYRYCPRCGQRIDWEHDDLYDKRRDKNGT